MKRRKFLIGFVTSLLMVTQAFAGSLALLGAGGAGGGGGGGWTPAQMTGLVGWYDAQVTASLSLSGSNILTVADQSPSGATMGQYSGRNRPTYSSTGLNGLPAMMFSAASSQMLGTAASFPMGTGTTATIWWVGYWTSASGDSARPMAYVGSGQTHDWNNAGSWVLERGGTSTNHRMQRNSNGTGYQALAYSTPRRFIATVKSDGTLTFYMNGVAGSTTNSGGSWISAGVLSLGSGSLDAAYIDGAMGEAGVATSYSDATAVTQLDDYLKAKWQLDPATQFLARTTGLDATHTNAYTTLINGLDSDNLWYLFDFLYVTATQDSTTALLNLVSSSYTLVPFNSPTFTADRGFIMNGTTSYLDTGFNARTATNRKQTQDNAHIMAWSINNVQADLCTIGAVDGSSINSLIAPRIMSGVFQMNLNSNGNVTASSSSSIGLYLGHRGSSTFMELYKNGISLGGDLKNSSLPPNVNVYFGGCNSNGTAAGSPYQVSAGSYGAAFPGGATDYLKFYNRMRTYGTAVGVP